MVDATHPYACVVSRNIKEAVEGMGIPYLRLEGTKGVGRKNKGRSHGLPITKTVPRRWSRWKEIFC